MFRRTYATRFQLFLLSFAPTLYLRNPVAKILVVCLIPHCLCLRMFTLFVGYPIFIFRKLYRIRSCLDLQATESLVHAFITSRLDYCNCLLFGVSSYNLVKLQRIQNAAARLCLKIPRRANVSSMSLLYQLHWLPVEFRIHFKLLLLTFKCLNGLAPGYLSSFLVRRLPPRSLRSLDDHLLEIPRSTSVSFGDRAFPIAAPRLWNNLPLYLRCSSSLLSFKSGLKTYLFRQAFSSHL